MGGRPGRLPDLFISGRAPAQAVEVHQRAGRRRAAVQAAVLGATSAARASATVASPSAKAAKMGDYLRYAMFDKYFKKIGNCASPHLPGGHRQERLALPDVLVLRVGRRRPTPNGRLVVAHRLQPQPLRLPEPDGGAGR